MDPNLHTGKSAYLTELPHLDYTKVNTYSLKELKLRNIKSTNKYNKNKVVLRAKSRTKLRISVVRLKGK